MNGELSYEIRVAALAMLKADPLILALVKKDAKGNPKVFDFVPQGVDPPFIILGTSSGQDSGDKDNPGQDVTFPITFYSRERSDRDILLFLQAANRLFHQKKVNLQAGDAYNSRFAGSMNRMEGDGITRQGYIKFLLSTIDTTA